MTYRYTDFSFCLFPSSPVFFPLSPINTVPLERKV